MNNRFVLSDTYEYVVDLTNSYQLLRIEVFQSAESSNVFRGRVWLSGEYQLYPVQFSDVSKGKATSIEALNVELTLKLRDAEELIRGKKYASKEAFVEYVLASANSLISAIAGPTGSDGQTP